MSVVERTCPSCGHQNLDDAKFCGRCGLDLRPEPVAAAAIAPAPPVEPAEPSIPAAPVVKPKRTVLGMPVVTAADVQARLGAGVPDPNAEAQSEAAPTRGASEPANATATPLRHRTMLGMPMVSPGAVAPSAQPLDSAHPEQSDAPTAKTPDEHPKPSLAQHAPAIGPAPTTNRTMLGMPVTPLTPAGVPISPATPSTPRSASDASKPTADPLGPSHRTMLGMPATDPASVGRSSYPPAALPAHPPRQRSQVQFADGTDEIALPVKKPGAGLLIVVVLLLGLVVLSVLGLGGYFLFGHEDVDVVASIVQTDAGEALSLRVPGAAPNTKLRFAGHEQALEGGVAEFPLAADALRIGDNALTVEVVDADGAVESTTVTLTVSYRVRADVSGLANDAPNIAVVVDAIPGSQVTIGDAPLALDASGRGQVVFPIDAALDRPLFEHDTGYRVVLPDGQSHAGSVRTRIPFATLQVDRPGVSALTDQADVEIAGAVHRSAAVMLDGVSVPVTGGRFVSQKAVPLGETDVRVVARQAGRAPRVATIHIRRVADLAREAASFRPDEGMTYARVHQSPATYRGRKIALDGRVYNVDVSSGQSVIQILVRDCPRGQRCPLWVTYPQATDATVDSWVRVLGTVSGEQQFRSESDRVISVPRVDAEFVFELPGQAP